MTKVYLVSGYAGSGKDTLFSILSGDVPKNYVNMKIYCKRGYESEAVELKKNKKMIRFAFADLLKEEVKKIWKLTPDVDWNSIKEKKIGYLGKSFRELCIEHGIERRNSEVNYWVDRVVEKIESNDENKNIMITDWRFPNEFFVLLKKFNVITIRVVRSDVKPRNMDCETYLDDVCADLLITDDFEDACVRLPLYKEFNDVCGLI